MKGLLGCLGTTAMLLVLPLPLAAQEGPVTFELSFSSPGARSMGLGGAFVALADDATAAFANPAGLVQLLKPEVSMEGRWQSYETPYVAGGRASAEPSGIGIDTASDQVLARPRDRPVGYGGPGVAVARLAVLTIDTILMIDTDDRY